MAQAFALIGAFVASSWFAPTLAVGWLVGSWLFGPKSDLDNQIFDPGAEEMPRFNQSLRGVTIPVLFGTNRVSSNVVWTKNYTSTRHEESTGGAGGKAAKKIGSSTPTNVFYTYSWDMMFHLGMGPGPYNLFGGWSGASPLHSDTLAAIITNSEGIASVGYFESDVARIDTTTLEFDEGFFGFGGETGSTQYSNWAYFATQEGVLCRWPYTYYVGFKRLGLGEQASVPQLTFEIGPGDIEWTYSPTFIDAYRPHDVGGGGSSGFYNYNAAFLRGADSQVYSQVQMFFSATTPAISLVRLSDQVVLTRTRAEFDADCTAMGLDPGSAYVFDDPVPLIIQGTKYFWILGTYDGAGARTNVAGVLYEITSAGAINPLGGFQYRSGDRFTYKIDIRRVCVVGTIPDGSTPPSPITNKLLVGFFNTTPIPNMSLLTNLPSVSEAIGAALISDTVDNKWDSLAVSLNGKWADPFFDATTYRSGVHVQRAFILPKVSSLGAWTGLLCAYVGNAETQYHLDFPADSGNSPYIATQAATYPTGFITAIPIDMTLDSIALGTVQILNTSFVDESGAAMVPFSDAGKNKDGTTGVDSDDWLNPSVQLLTEQGAAGLTLILFPRVYYDETPDLDPVGSYAKVAAYIWNPFSAIATLYVVDDGATYDPVVDIGVGRYTNNAAGQVPWFDEFARKLYTLQRFENPSTVSQRAIVSELGTMTIGGGSDVLPPYIIYTILTNTVFGFSIPTSRIDSTSYAAALATCDAEGTRVSVSYLREESMLSVIDELLTLYGGFLIDSGGIIRFGIHRSTDTAVTPIIDNSRLVVDSQDQPPVLVTKGARVDGFNYVKVNYFDRDLFYRQNFIEVSDEVDMDLNGIRAKEFQAKFTMNGAVATKLAERALWNNLYARDVYQLTLGWKDAHLEPGDVITLQDSFHHELATGVRARIAHWHEKERGKFSVTAVQELAYAVDAVRTYTNAASLPSGADLFDDPLAPADFRMYELPKEFQASQAMLYVGYNQLHRTMGAQLYLSDDNATFALAQNVQPYIISGILPEALPDRDTGYIEQDVTIHLMPTSGFISSSPTYVQTHALSDITQALRGAGMGTLIAGSEAMAIQGLTLLSQNTYKVDKVFRGWGGTNIQAHNSGAYWHRHGAGIFEQEISEDQIGNILYYKVVPYNFGGQTYNVGSIVSKSYQIGGGFWKPQVMPWFKAFVNSLAIFTSSDDLRGARWRQVFSGGADATFTWPAASRIAGFGAGGHGAGGYGNFTQEVATPTYRVQVLSSNLTTVVRCTVANTGFFTYTRAQNSADFNGFAGDYTVRVTPYNSYGDAPLNQQRRLTLFW